MPSQQSLPCKSTLALPMQTCNPVGSNFDDIYVVEKIGTKGAAVEVKTY